MIQRLSIVLFSFSLIINVIQAQSSADSLLLILNTGNAAKYSKHIYRLSTALPHPELKAIMPQISASLQKNILLRDTMAIAYLTELKARYYYNFTLYGEATKAYIEALSLFKSINEESNIARCYVMLSNIESDKGNFVSSMSYCDSALIIAKKQNNKRFLSRIYNNIGILFFRSGKNDKALEMYFNSLDIKLKLDDKEGIANTYNNIGEAYYRMQKNTEAHSFFDKSLNIRRSINDLSGVAEVLNNIGKLSERNLDFSGAEKAFLESLEISSKLKLDLGIAYNYNNLGKLYIKTDQLDSAKTALNKGLSIAKKQQLKEIVVSIYQQLSNLAEKQNNTKDALMYMRLCGMYKDSLRFGDLQRLEELSNTKMDTILTELESNNLKYNNSRLKWIIVLLVVIIILIITSIIVYLNRLQKGFLQRLRVIRELSTNSHGENNDYRQQLMEEVDTRTKELQLEIFERQKVDAALKKALKRAEDAIYLKNAFLANMSHEIRTPLNGIIGFASLLESELSAQNNQELYDYANGISQSGERLLLLLTNLIDISRLEANDLEVNLQVTPIRKMMESVYDLFKFKANEKAVTLNLVDGVEVYAEADAENLSRIVSNILDNALKYTEKGSIHLSCGIDNERNKAFIRIVDTGIGIDSEYIQHIFEPFRQESLGFSRAYQGAGLGLPLAKRLIKLMKGEIEVQSNKGEGTTVNLFLGLAPTSQSTQHTDESRKVISTLEVAEKELNIMIVEDDRMNRIVLQKMLKNTGQISMGVDGDESLQIIKKNYKQNVIFDIMLVDINLPVPWDGIILMKKIKELYPEYKNIPFIAQTAYAMSGDRERLLEAGFDDYIPKPISKKQLFSTLKKHSTNKKQDATEG